MIVKSLLGADIGFVTVEIVAGVCDIVLLMDTDGLLMDTDGVRDGFKVLSDALRLSMLIGLDEKSTTSKSKLSLKF